MNVIEKGSLTLEDSILDTIMTMMNMYHKPIYPVTLAAFPEDEIMHTKEGSKYKVIIYRTPEMAVFCLSKQYQYSRYLQMRSSKKKDRNAKNAS